MRSNTEGKVMIGKRRDKLEVIEDILKAADKPEGANKTHLVYGSNLNFNRLRVFLPFLLEKGLLEECDDGSTYLTTGKGRDFLRQLSNMQDML